MRKITAFVWPLTPPLVVNWDADKIKKFKRLANKFKQHVIPKTYLKYFSANNDGKGIYVINTRDKFKKTVQIKDSGDSIFWEKKYYNSDLFATPTALEEIFGKDIEPLYTKIINRISTEKPVIELEIKQYLVTWIFASINRGTKNRFGAERMIEIRNFISRLYPNAHSLDRPPYVEEKDKKRIAKEVHLNAFADNEKRRKHLEELSTFLSFKRWEILVAPPQRQWITSDDPGFVGYYENERSTFRVTPVWDFKSGDFMYYPLTKKYCLHVHPYYEDDDVSLNLTNTPVSFRIATDHESDLINKWTFATMHHLLIAATEDEFKNLGRIIQEMH